MNSEQYDDIIEWLRAITLNLRQIGYVLLVIVIILILKLIF